MERRTERFYVRVRPSLKKWLFKKAEKDGFKDNITDWFEQKILEWKKENGSKRTKL